VKKSRVPRASKISAVPWKLDAPQLNRLRSSLLSWFRREKRTLPWRDRRDPYRVWISEIMLQQTRVAAVIPYYETFLQRFPTIQSLAQARIESVLQSWAGLGYYSRARNLHQAAKQIVERHSGEFPRTMEEAMALSGIGAYTSAAILSISYGYPAAVLDGNVARVLARLSAIRGDLRAPKQWTVLKRAADTLLDANYPSDWNESMMELGATICTPRTPKCESCPIAGFCCARSLGIQNDLPAKRVKRATEQITIAAAVFVDPAGCTLLIRPPAQHANSESAALFSRLWQFPAVIVRRNARTELISELKSLFKSELAKQKFVLHSTISKNHTVTFRKIKLAPFLVGLKELPASDTIPQKILQLRAVTKLAVSSATRKIANAAIKSLATSNQ
jgi:A/G-specific adenine glycosylase